MSDSTFDVNAFIQESKAILFNPKSYFPTMKTSGGIAEPLIKAVIYGALSGAIAFIWSILRIGAVGGGIFGSAVGVMIFIWTIFAAVIGLFIGAVILLVISSICKGNSDFEANVRVTAALMVMMPVNSFFAFAGHFSVYLALIFSLAVSLYSLWLLYNGLVEALKTNPETTKIVSYVLVALVVLFLLIGLGARRRANQFMKEFNNSDVKEMLKDNPKN